MVVWGCVPWSEGPGCLFFWRGAFWTSNLSSFLHTDNSDLYNFQGPSMMFNFLQPPTLFHWKGAAFEPLQPPNTSTPLNSYITPSHLFLKFFEAFWTSATQQLPRPWALLQSSASTTTSSWATSAPGTSRRPRWQTWQNTCGRHQRWEELTRWVATWFLLPGLASLRILRPFWVSVVIVLVFLKGLLVLLLNVWPPCLRA